MKNRFAAALLPVVSLLIALSCNGEACGQGKLPRVGILSFSTATEAPRLEAALEASQPTLAGEGWIEGKNVSFEYRGAHSDPSQFATAAAALVELKVDVIRAVGVPSLRAAYAATRMIPIVAADFTTDPIAEGYAQSCARPARNVTGVFLDAPEFAGKWFELLKEMVSDLSHVSVLWDPGPGIGHGAQVQVRHSLMAAFEDAADRRTPSFMLG
jgi:ABC-type uncharacterized transport system substrate-binding protein